MKNKKVLMIVIIFLSVLLTGGLVLGIILATKGKMNRSGSGQYGRTILEQCYAYNDQGKREYQGDTVYYFDSNNTFVRKKDTLVLGEKQERITDTEYDSKGRIISEKTTETKFGIATEESVTTYQYFQDTDFVTDSVSTAKDGTIISSQHMEYDDDGVLLSEEFFNHNTKDEIRIIKYNDKGVRISDELSCDSRTIQLTEYNKNSQTTWNYQRNSDPMWMNLPEDEVKTLYSSIDLLPDGSISKVREYEKEWIPEGGKYVDALVSETEYRYFTGDAPQYYEEGDSQNSDENDFHYPKWGYHSSEGGEAPYPEGSEHVEIKYNDQGELTWEYVYDSEGREIEIIEYENGSVKSRFEYDYHATDPDFPGEEVKCSKIYRLNSDGELCLAEEYWSKNFHREAWVDSNIDQIYRGEEIYGDKRITIVESEFYDNGMIRKQRMSVSDSGASQIREYDEYGNMIKWSRVDANGNLSVFEEFEYNY